MIINRIEEESIIHAIEKLEQNEITELPNSLDFEYLRGLNKEQKIAATRKEGNYLVIAGPGAGKTHTLIYRIVHLIKSGVPARELCIVTFTRKAANELKYRVQSILPDVELGFVGTIHALSYLLIRRGVKNIPRLIDPEDDLMVLRLVIQEGNFDLPQRIQNRTILKLFDYMNLTQKTMAETLIDQNRENLNVDNLMEIYKAYTKYKEDNGYINYSDCISLAKGLDRGFLNYLMIDEFQDTDPLQLSMLKSLDFPNVMAIGDDFQSIYSFRGADNKIILKFGEHFDNAKVIKLKVNYRSTQEIVDLENYITNDSKLGYKKELISNRGKSKIPVVFRDLREDQTDFILERIKHFDKQSLKGKIAIIYRYNRRKSFIEAELIKNKIDYVVYGGLRLLDRKHIKDLFAIVLSNRNKNDFIPYMRSLTLLDGVGEVTAKKLIQNNMESPRENVKKLREILFYDYTDLMELINDAEKFYLTLETVLKKSNYTIDEIKDDFNILKDMAKDYTEISNFISDIVIDNTFDQWSNKEKKANVVLTTIHSSKGLEFDEVHFLYDPQIEYTVAKQEENRRLFYTAISRAKTNLYIYDAWGRMDIDSIIKDFNDEFYSYGDSFVNEEPLSIELVVKKSKQKKKVKNEQLPIHYNKNIFTMILDALKGMFK